MNYEVFFSYTGWIDQEADSPDEAKAYVLDALGSMSKMEIMDYLEGPDIDDILEV